MIPFLELKSRFRAIEPEVRSAIDRVLDRGWYVLGEEVQHFEREFADWLGVEHVVGVASGTDAIHLALRALGVGPGDEVITVANTCVPTVTAIEAAGARPVLVDATPDTLTMDPDGVASAITPKTRALVPVHLYGHPCDMDALMPIAEEHGLMVVEDCAQAHGARYRGRPCGTFGHAAAFSFYPSKNLGAYGDAGAVATGDSKIAERLRRLRSYGQEDRYRHVERGVNSRLDELQAAILRAELPHLDAWNQSRRMLAERYDRLLEGLPARRPAKAQRADSSWHLYVVRTQHRDALRTHLKARGVGTEIHYPIPVHLQPACAHLGYSRGHFPVAERAAGEIVSLPLYPELAPDDVDIVVHAIGAFQP